MISDQKIVIIIPARYKSSRFEGKPLANILGEPMILKVCKLCNKVLDKQHIYVATDNILIKEMVEGAGFHVVMTSESHETGTDRVAEASTLIDANIYINVQGDEPVLNPEDIRKIIKEKLRFKNHVINGYTTISPEEDPDNKNIPKVIFTEKKQMVYMSRQKIPGFKSDTNKPNEYFKQVCIYAFNNSELEAFSKFGGKTSLENFEDIEILRFLELDIPVKLVKTASASVAVDVPEDIAKVERYILNREKI